MTSRGPERRAPFSASWLQPSPASAAITSGFSGTAGTHIVYLDYSHLVDIQVASTDTFIIHNANTIAMAGVVTLIW